MIFNYCISYSQVAVTVGPIFTWNFSTKEKTKKYSVGIEISFHAALSNEKKYWYSIDLGYESQADIKRIYSELQVINASSLFFIGGLSSGPVFEFGKEINTRFGWQVSTWGNFLLVGGIIRYRYINRNHYLAPGYFIKIPIIFSEG